MLTPKQKRLRRNAYMRQYYANHKEKTAALVRKYRAAHPEKKRAWQRSFYARHKKSEYARTHAWALANPEKVRAKNLRWRRKNRTKLYEYTRKNRSAYPEKHRAQEAVRRAVKDGKLIRPDHCGKCGKVCKPDAHHHRGYAIESYLDVLWWCECCHNRYHKTKGHSTRSTKK